MGHRDGSLVIGHRGLGDDKIRDQLRLRQGSNLGKVTVTRIANRVCIIPRSGTAVVKGGVAVRIVGTRGLVRGVLCRVESAQGRGIGTPVYRQRLQTLVVNAPEIINKQLIISGLITLTRFFLC